MGAEQSTEMEVLSDDVKLRVMKLVEDGLQFVDPPDGILCRNCGAVPLFHCIYPCSHIYCRDCYVHVFQRLKKKCRVCQTEIGAQIMHSKEIESAIPTLKVICPNSSFGCKEQITLNKFMLHLEQCKFLLAQQLDKLSFAGIDKKKSGEFKIQRASNNEFERPVDDLVNRNKNSDSNFKKLTDDNRKLLAEVRNLAGANAAMLTRIAALEKQAEHFTNKSREEDEAIRKQAKSLEQKMQLFTDTIATFGPSIGKENMDHLTNAVNALQDQMQTAETKFNILSNRLDTLDPKAAEDSTKQRRSDFRNLRIDNLTEEEIKTKMEEIGKWRNGSLLGRIQDYDKKKKEKDFVSINAFYSSQYGHKMMAWVKFDGTHLSGLIQLMPGEYDDRLPSGFHFRVTYTILAQSDGIERRDVTQMDEPRFGMTTNQWCRSHRETRITDYSLLEKQENQNVYLKNDTIYVKVTVEPISHLFLDYFSRDGILLWTIDNYFTVKHKSLQGIRYKVYSDYFYSSERGYRMQACLDWSGGNINISLSVLVGEYDDDLSSSFDHKCKIHVVNQRDKRSRHDFFVASLNFDEDLIDFEEDYCHSVNVECWKVERSPFLMNNRFVLKVSVEEL